MFVSFNFITFHTSNVDMTNMFTVLNRFITQGLSSVLDNTAAPPQGVTVTWHIKRTCSDS